MTRIFQQKLNSNIFEIFTFYFPRYIEERKKARIFARVIQENSKKTRELKKLDEAQFRITKALAEFATHSATFIYGDNVAILKLVEKEPIGVIIRDKEIAQDQHRLFEILWKIAQ